MHTDFSHNNDNKYDIMPQSQKEFLGIPQVRISLHMNEAVRIALSLCPPVTLSLTFISCTIGLAVYSVNPLQIVVIILIILPGLNYFLV